MMKRIAWSTAVAGILVLGFTAAPTFMGAQGRSGVVVEQAIKHDISPPLDQIRPIPPTALTHHAIPLRFPFPPHWPFQAPRDPVLQQTATTTSAATVGLGFLGVGVGINSTYSDCCAPPDTNGAAGATQFVQWVNLDFAVFDKATGTLTYGPAAGNTLWSGFGSPCETSNSGDPIAQYDKQAGRWVMMQPVFSSPYYMCVAVSTSSDATGSFYRYAFPIPNNYFPDYPKLGVWLDGYYISYNSFKGNSFAGATACAMDGSAMRAGTSATMQCFQQSSSVASLLPADLDGATSASGTTSAPPTGSPEYFLNFTSNALNIWQFHANFATPSSSTFTGPVSVSGVAPFSEACGGGACIPQAGTTQKLDSLGDRLMYRLAYRNFASVSPAHEDLVVTHSVATGSGNTGVRWYDIQSPGSSPVVVQQSTYAPDSNYRWMGSAAMDKFGDIALGYSVSSGSMYPAIRYTGRTPSDPLNTMETENSIIEGGGSQGRNLSRWGDYSSMAVDPVDDCTFWYTNEYLQSSGTFNWSTRIASFAFPGCSGGTSSPDFSLSASPSSLTLTQGQSGTSTITVTALNGFSSTVGLTVSGCPTSPANACVLSPTSVTGSGSSTLTVTTDNTTATGSYTITITGTSGSLVHSTAVPLTVNPPASGDFSISATPGNVTLKGAGTATYTVSVTPSSGYTGTVNLTVTGVPSGSSSTFSPAAITNGSGSSKLTVTNSSTLKGNYTLTITGADSSGSPSHSVSVGYKVR